MACEDEVYVNCDGNRQPLSAEDLFRLLVREDASGCPVLHVDASLDAGDVNIGNVDVSSIAAGSNIIGKVGIDQTTPGTTNGVVVNNVTKTRVRILTANSTAVAIKASAGDLWSWNINNLHSATIFVKIYNIAAGSVNPASDVPIKTLMVAANGAVYQEPNCVQTSGSTALSVRVVTDSGDTGTTAPATLPILEFEII